MHRNFHYEVRDWVIDKKVLNEVMKMAKYEMKLEHLCEVVAYLTPPIPIGPSSWGVRLIFPIVEGTVKGPRLKGKCQPFGADWGLIRGDNCLELDVRLVIETEDGALIHTYYMSFGHFKISANLDFTTQFIYTLNCTARPCIS